MVRKRYGGTAYRPSEALHLVPKMSYKRLISLGLDAIFSFSDLPIKVCLYTGIVGMLGFLAGCIQFLFLGIVGEYVFRIDRESQNRPNLSGAGIP
jgi:hypothetical protein